MKTQLEFLKLAVQLSEANPNMKIKVFIICEELCDDYVWQEHKIYSVSILDYYVHHDDLILVDEDEIRDAIAERFDIDNQHTDEVKIEKMIDEIYKEEVIKVIAIRVGKSTCP